MVATDCLVYLGPSLSRGEAEQILPNALFLPPACCLDVTLALRLDPRVIVLIDGVYETVGAVWHKELLLALEHGVHVLGGASMGALRAAEMAPFGMEGVGAIFRDYRAGVFTDDDDVAVLHTPDGVAVSDAVVNISATLQRARQFGLLSTTQADDVLAAAKRRFYQERTLETLVSELARRSSGGDRTALERFGAWCRRGGFVDQKAIDARETLRRAREIVASPPRSGPRSAAPRTIFLRQLEELAATSPFASYHRALPHEEKVALAARFLGAAYTDTKRLALFLRAVDGISAGLPLVSRGDRRWLETIEADLAPWLESLDGAVEYAAHLLRLDGDFAPLARGGRDPIAHLEASDAPRHARLLLTARLWRVVEASAGRQGLRLSHDQLQDRAELFRQQHHLTTDAGVADWLRANALSLVGFQNLLVGWALFEHAGHLQRPPAGDGPRPRYRWWLLEALHAAGTYEGAEATLATARRGEPVRLPDTDDDACRCDFQWGRWSAEADLRAMAADAESARSADTSPSSAVRT